MDAVRTETVASTIAKTLVEARLSATALPGYPGDTPATLADSYEIQDIAIGLYPGQVAGWKVGLIAPALRPELGAERLAGPVFKNNIWSVAPGEAFALPVIPGGFAAAEAEFILEVGKDTPADKTDWSLEDAEAYVGAVYIGFELAGSPLPDINGMGPRVVASDFGNNAGLIVGPEVKDWREKGWDALPCETWIDDKLIGTGTAASIPGSPMEAFRFLVEHCARRGRPLKAGDLITTGAATGVHEIFLGQSTVVRFGEYGEIACTTVKAEPHQA
ncbi:2-keto-4-pentenoate hydratase [Caulobacter sp. NIBR2454]|uniref:2-keto-4-pentenoate hydratase n=1 Tax=Caulobacter sp. NIBR2454 TaxID=3015996 RepID=UPI0022B61B96|nr:fumarylacetoacetate hydrolase family protein [Caulobacter sp. NIBR2454]